MNFTRQFWTLFKFQLTSSPLIWIYLLAFSAPLLISFQGGNYLDLLTSSPNLFFVGFLGVVLLAPEIFYNAALGQSNQWAAYSSEFLLTRAVDRNLLARSKAVALYLLALIVPTLMFFISLRHPVLQITSFTKSEQQSCLTSIPGSILLKDKYGRSDLISIPGGDIFVAAWHVWMVLLAALIVQLLIAFIQPLRYRKYIFWGIFGFFIMAPLLNTLVRANHPGADYSPWSESGFFFFAGHRDFAWSSLILLFLLTQRVWERRFAKFEQ
jgi:hypothetical protein